MPLTHAEATKCNIDVMKAYCDTAKSYVQIASAAIAAPFVFTQTILGSAGTGGGVSWPLAAAWSCFLITVASGLVYQWLAIRLVSNDLNGVENKVSRSIPYGAMVASFFVGAVFFVVFAWNRLGGKFS